MTRLAVAVALSVMGVVGCGSDAKRASIAESTTASSIVSSAATDSTVVSGPDHAALVATAVERIVGGDGGDQLDRACVEQQFDGLSDGDLRRVAIAAPDSTAPELKAIGLGLLDCLDLGAGTGSADSPMADGPDPCSLLSTTDLEPVFDDLEAGTSAPGSGPFGTGSVCTWADTSGKLVTLSLFAGAALDAWAAEAANGDGLSDGTPIEGVGDRAFVNRGDLSFATGSMLVVLHCFPSFDIVPETLLTIAKVVDGQL